MLNTGFAHRAGHLLRVAVVLGSAWILAGFDSDIVRPGHAEMQQWLLPASPPVPADNVMTDERVSLGKMLFFDTRLSGDGNISCASCHNPMFGWSDGLPTGRGFRGERLGRASPTIINTAFNDIQMWDGRAATLEDQAMGPMMAASEMNMDLDALFSWLNGNSGYREAFDRAYPGEPISADTISKALAAFERTIVSNDSPFDRWISGDADAMSAQQVRGLNIFLDDAKGNCAVCHSAPNFTDNGFHNVGLSSHGVDNPDMGRFEHVPVGILKGAFKTPTLRNITSTAPYFHDGSATTLMEVVEHYDRGGDVHENLSPNMKALNLSSQEKQDLVAFLRALAAPMAAVVLPELPAGLPPAAADREVAETVADLE